MADIRDSLAAVRAAEAAQHSLQTYGGQVEDGERENLALAVCLAADAICEHLAALRVHLDYLSHGR